MPERAFAAELGRRWFSIIVLGSAFLVVVTFFSFVFERGSPAARVAFWIGLAGENNIGAWWSGMLLLLASVLALDGFAAARDRLVERRGWLALAAVLLFLSFDEVGSLHEYLAGLGRAHIGALALWVFAVTCYAFVQLLRAGVGVRIPALLLLGFALLGTVPLQEVLQHSREWPNPVIYGLRGALEEGVELAGILVLVAVTSRNTRALLHAPEREAIELARHRGRVLGVGAALAPVLVAATFVLPYPGGPADWLGAAGYFGCALLVVRRMLRSPGPVGAPVVVLFAWYLAASLGSNAVKLTWDPAVLGTAVGLRGLFLALLLVTAVPILGRAGRRVNPLVFGAGAIVAVVAALWPDAQVVWCGLPVVVAWHVYSIESGAVAEEVGREASGGVAVARTTEG